MQEKSRRGTSLSPEFQLAMRKGFGRPASRAADVGGRFLRPVQCSSTVRPGPVLTSRGSLIFHFPPLPCSKDCFYQAIQKNLHLVV